MQCDVGLKNTLLVTILTRAHTGSMFEVCPTFFPSVDEAAQSAWASFYFSPPCNLYLKRFFKNVTPKCLVVGVRKVGSLCVF